MGIDVALTGGADHAGEDLLGLRAAQRAIAATDFAVDDGRAHGVFGSPVGRVDAGIPQEGEHGGKLDGEMVREAPRVGEGRRGVDETAEACAQVPACDGEAVIGDRVRVAPVAKRKGVREEGLYACRPGAARMVEAQRATPAKQVRDTRLMLGLGESAIRRPPVTHEDAIEVRAQDRGRVVKAPTGTNRVHGGVWCRKRPEPVEHGADPPPGFIGTDDGTPANLVAQGGIGRRGDAGGAMQHVHQTPGRHRQPEALAQQRRDLLQRHTVVFVQQDDEGHRLGAEVDAGRPQRVRRLPGMPALRAAATRDAATHRHVEASDDRPDHGEIFLILRRDARALDRAATARTRGRKRRGIGFIDPRGNRSSSPAPIPAARAPTRPPPPALRAIFGERGRLTEAGAPRRLKVLLEALVLTFQLIAFASYACHLVTQARDVLLLALDQIVAFVAGRTCAFVGHATFMADSLKKYKYGILDLAWSQAETR